MMLQMWCGEAEVYVWEHRNQPIKKLGVSRKVHIHFDNFELKFDI